MGLVVVDVGGIPLTLGSGGGCLLAGLLFGWMRGKHPMYGVMPSAASQLLKDFGLAAFVAVVGINSSIRTASDQTSGQSGSIGLGFAIPIDEVMPIVDQMAQGETPTHARLGLQVGNPQTGDDAGAVVNEVTSGSTAGKGGLTPGDVITQVDDQRITDADSLVATIRSYGPGDSVTVTWTSNGQQKTGDFVLDSDATTS
jgi:putative serine protease PepD